MIASIAAVTAGGLLLALAFPPNSLDLIAWVAFIPLLQVIHTEKNLGAGFLYGTVFGAAFFLVDVHWMYQTLVTHGHFEPLWAGIVFLGMIFTLSLFPAVFAYGLVSLHTRGLSISFAAPFLWTGTEYLRSILFSGFPWDLVGYSQSGRLLLVQIADLTGVYGVSFLVVLVNGALWEAFRRMTTGRRFPWRFSAASALILAVTLVYGHIRSEEFSSNRGKDRFEVGILQGNIPQHLKWADSEKLHTFKTYERLGKKAVHQGAKLLIWPETAAPVLFGSGNSEWRQATDISNRLGVPMLVGAPSYREERGITEYFNSAFLVEGNELRQRYNKIHLVPFGEYMPLSWLLPLGPGIAAREADYTAGNNMTIMEVPGCPPFGVLICYEAIFPELARLAVNHGARMLVNITNDGWFGASAAPYQHLNHAGMRCIENRVWLIRAANTGISAVVDPVGRIRKQVNLDEQGVLIWGIPSDARAGSLYSLFGDVFCWACITLVCVMYFSQTNLFSGNR